MSIGHAVFWSAVAFASAFTVTATALFAVIWHAERKDR